MHYLVNICAIKAKHLDTQNLCNLEHLRLRAFHVLSLDAFLSNKNDCHVTKARCCGLIVTYL